MSTELSFTARVAASPAVAGFQPLVLAVAVAACFGSTAALAQPTGAQAIHGAASLSQQGNRLVVTTQNGAGSNHSAINWQSFSVPAGSATQFNQPSAASTSINRVVGTNPSAIFGTLSSNGKLVLVNPSGIAVGAGAVVDTAGFTASTLRMSDADALAGRLRFGDGSAAGALSVQGQVVARGGDIVLIAPQLEIGAAAVVQAIGGDTILAAGQKVSITGRGLEGIQLEVQAPADRAVNLGKLQGDSVGMFAGQLQHSGLVQAASAVAEGGKVVLKAVGDTLVDGRITATAGTRGGSVDLLGGRVALFGSAVVDASGSQGGGQVREGGDYQGANAGVPNASHSFVGEGVSIRADAGVQGDGGRVIVWSDEGTRMRGQISARGGEQGGNGGFAEVSGKQFLEFTGLADLRAPHGTVGTLLLDPSDIEIRVAGPSTVPPAVGYDFSGGPASAVLMVSDLERQLGLGHTRVVATDTSGGPPGGSITVSDAVNWTSGNALALEASNGIVLNADVKGWANASRAAAGGKLLLYAKGPDGITQSNGIVQVSELILASAAGAVTMAKDNKVGKLAASVASLLDFRNVSGLSIGSLSNPFLLEPVAGIAAGDSISISAGGNINLGTSNVHSYDGDITVKAGIVGSTPGNGSILGSANITNITNISTGYYGVHSGSVTLKAHGAGTINVGNIDTYGWGVSSESIGTNGGHVTVTSASGAITTGTINTSGYSGYGGYESAGGAGGDGGNVSINSTGGGAIRPGAIFTFGGSGGSGYDDGAAWAGGRGGKAGNVTVVTSGLLSTNHSAGSAAFPITALGGVGGSSDTGAGGNGGAGGVVSLQFGSLAAGSLGTIATRGGDGGLGATVNPGDSSLRRRGGNGGDVSIKGTVGNQSLTDLVVIANGGDGGEKRSASSADSSGGDSGNISVKATAGNLALGGLLFASGGLPGVLGESCDACDPPMSLTPGTGAGGVFTLSATGGTVQVFNALLLDGAKWGNNSQLAVSSGGSIGGTIVLVNEADGGVITVTDRSSITPSGGVENRGTLNIGNSEGSGSYAYNVNLTRNLGLVDVRTGELYTPSLSSNEGRLTVSGALHVGYTSDASGGPSPGNLTNLGTIQGSGTVYANLTNSGTVSPGIASTPTVPQPIDVRIGALTIEGNFIQTSSGTLSMEIAGPRDGPNEPYDRLIVRGTTVLGGHPDRTAGVATATAFAAAVSADADDRAGTATTLCAGAWGYLQRDPVDRRGQRPVQSDSRACGAAGQ